MRQPIENAQDRKNQRENPDCTLFHGVIIAAALLLSSLSCLAQFPMPVTPAVAGIHHANNNPVVLPSISPIQYMVYTWPASISPNVAEYKFYLSPTLSPWIPTLVKVTKGFMAIVPIAQYPIGFGGVSAIGSDGLESPIRLCNAF